MDTQGRTMLTITATKLIDELRDRDLVVRRYARMTRRTLTLLFRSPMIIQSSLHSVNQSRSCWHALAYSLRRHCSVELMLALV